MPVSVAELAARRSQHGDGDGSWEWRRSFYLSPTVTLSGSLSVSHSPTLFHGFLRPVTDSHVSPWTDTRARSASSQPLAGVTPPALAAPACPAVPQATVHPTPALPIGRAACAECAPLSDRDDRRAYLAQWPRKIVHTLPLSREIRVSRLGEDCG